ncbi:MAG: DUF1345 domain-containing protein [Novosphingobium sp.]|nr:DUF1345 domain-containing protein [Novosphingobium sp.]
MGRNLRHPRYLLFLAVFALVGAPLLAFLGTSESLLIGFDVAVATFVVSCASLWNARDPDSIRREAERDDARQGLLLLLTALITAIVLIALSNLILSKTGLEAAEIALLVATLAASWGFANLVYAFHYARLYYTSDESGDRKGLDFPGDAEPVFSDFVNFAFVIGMTCQTADVAITSTRLRRISTWHGLFAFVFNLGILALTVNVLAGN